MNVLPAPVAMPAVVVPIADLVTMVVMPAAVVVAIVVAVVVPIVTVVAVVSIVALGSGVIVVIATAHRMVIGIGISRRSGHRAKCNADDERFHGFGPRVCAPTQ